MKNRVNMLCMVLGASVCIINGCGGGEGGPNLTDGTGTTGGTITGTTTGGSSSGTTTTGGATTTGGQASGTVDLISATGKLYKGTATVTLKDSVTSAPQTYSIGVKVLVDEPAQFRGVVEENPIHLMILPDIMIVGSGVTATDHKAGQFTLYTAYLQRSGLGSVTAMYPCWRLQNNGGALSGTLADNNHLTDEVNTVDVPTSIAANTVWPAPCLMSNGTRLSGQLDDHRVQIHLEGSVNTRQNFYPLTVDLTASR